MTRVIPTRLSVTTAVAGLSGVSVYTTALGLEFVLPQWTAWIAAVSMQFVLVAAIFSCIRALRRKQAGRARLLAATYALAALFSVAGSFISHDQRFSSEARAQALRLTTRQTVADYLVAATGSATSLKTAIEAQLVRLERKKGFEEHQGLLSGNGEGYGPRTASIVLLSAEVQTLRDEVVAANGRLIDLTGGLARLSADPRLSDFLGVLEPAGIVAAELRSDSSLFHDLLNRERQLGQTIGDRQGDVPELAWPAVPAVSTIDTSRSHLQVILAFSDLLHGRPGSIVAMLIAIMVDLLLVLVAWSGVEGIDSSSPKQIQLSAGWSNSARSYASFLARRSPSIRLALWTGLNSKIRWELRPPVVLTGHLTPQERALADYLARAGALTQRASGLFVTTGATNSLRRLIVGELQHIT